MEIKCKDFYSVLIPPELPKKTIQKTLTKIETNGYIIATISSRKATAKLHEWYGTEKDIILESCQTYDLIFPIGSSSSSSLCDASFDCNNFGSL